MTDKYITVTQAILGGNVKVQTLTNIVDVVVKPGTNDGTYHTLQERGVVNLPPNSDQKGDHIITFKVVIPERLTDSQREALSAYAKIEPQLQD